MRKAYSEIMDRVTVTDQMRERILNHVQAEGGSEIPLKQLSLETRFMKYRKYLAAAACLAVFAAGAVTWDYVNNGNLPQNPSGGSKTGNEAAAGNIPGNEAADGGTTDFPGKSMPGSGASGENKPDRPSGDYGCAVQAEDENNEDNRQTGKNKQADPLAAPDNQQSQISGGDLKENASAAGAESPDGFAGGNQPAGNAEEIVAGTGGDSKEQPGKGTEPGSETASGSSEASGGSGEAAGGTTAGSRPGGVAEAVSGTGKPAEIVAGTGGDSEKQPGKGTEPGSETASGSSEASGGSGEAAGGKPGSETEGGSGEAAGGNTASGGIGKPAVSVTSPGGEAQPGDGLKPGNGQASGTGSGNRPLTGMKPAGQPEGENMPGNQLSEGASGNQPSEGNIPGNQTTGGNTSGNQMPSGGNASGNQASGGNTTGNQTAGGNEPGNEPSGGSVSENQMPSGGNASGNQASGGSASGNQVSGGNASGNQASGGNASGNQVSGGSEPGNQTTGGSASGNQTSEGNMPGNQTVGGNEPGNQATGGNTSGNQSSGGSASGNQTAGGSGSEQNQDHEEDMPQLQLPGTGGGILAREKLPSVQELSETTGLPVTDIQRLPFEAEHTFYYAYNKELAEIIYQRNGYQAVFRKSAGNGDNSGDYTRYDEEKEVQINGRRVLLKGREGIYMLAVWEDGPYAYSLSLSFGQIQEKWEEMIDSIS